MQPPFLMPPSLMSWLNRSALWRPQGGRTTWTIEAGKIGNEKPMVISREIWHSPELMLTISSRDSEPRQREQNYRLEKNKRGERAAALVLISLTRPPAALVSASTPGSAQCR
jgi:hypothetical protein